MINKHQLEEQLKQMDNKIISLVEERNGLKRRYEDAQDEVDRQRGLIDQQHRIISGLIKLLSTMFEPMGERR